MIELFIKFKFPKGLLKEYFSLFILFNVLINNSYFLAQQDSIQISSQLESTLNWHAKDSIVIDMVNKETFLYNEGHIDYEEIILDACYIKFNFESI